MALEKTKIIDSITEAKKFWRTPRPEEGIRPTPKEKVQGLKFVQGQRVKDTITGKEVTIVAGVRKTATFRSPGSQGH